MAAALPDRECVRLDAGVQEGDRQRPLADGTALAYELVEAAVSELTASIPVDVETV